MNGQVGLNTKGEIESPKPTDPLLEEQNEIEITGEQQINSLKAHIERTWSINSQAKITSSGDFPSVQQRMINNRKMLIGQYESWKKAIIDAGGGTKHYARLAFPVAEQAAAWIYPTFFPPDGSPTFSLKPSPLPTLPDDKVNSIHAEAVKQAIAMGIYKQQVEQVPVSTDDVHAELRQQYNSMYSDSLDNHVQQAMEASEKMTLLIKDQLNRGDFNTALEEVISDSMWSPSIIMKAPVVRIERVVNPANINGEWTAEMEEMPVDKIERVDPFDFYPAPGMKHPNDGGAIQELLHMTHADLSSLRGVDGYKKDAIDKVLETYRATGYRRVTTVDAEKAQIEKIPYQVGTYSNIDCIEHWETVSGSLLKEWEVEMGIEIDKNKYYDICALLAGNCEVIRAYINPDKAGRKPYYVTGYKWVPGSIWNESLCDIVKDPQDAFADFGRAWINNGQKSSDSVTIIDKALLAEETANTTISDIGKDGIRPGYTIFVDSEKQKISTNIRPIDFYQPQNNGVELRANMDWLRNQAISVSGVPMPGNNLNPSPLQPTASGQAIDRTDGLKRLNSPIANINNRIVKPLIKDMYLWNMADPEVDSAMKGDLEVEIVGTASAVATEERLRKILELLNLAQNPIIAQSIGDGITEAIKDYVKLLGLNPSKIVQGSVPPPQPPMSPEQPPVEQPPTSSQGVVPLAQPTPLQPDGATEQGGAQPMEKVV